MDLGITGDNEKQEIMGLEQMDSLAQRTMIKKDQSGEYFPEQLADTDLYHPLAWLLMRRWRYFELKIG